MAHLILRYSNKGEGSFWQKTKQSGCLSHPGESPNNDKKFKVLICLLVTLWKILCSPFTNEPANLLSLFPPLTHNIVPRIPQNPRTLLIMVTYSTLKGFVFVWRTSRLPQCRSTHIPAHKHTHAHIFSILIPSQCGCSELSGAAAGALETQRIRERPMRRCSPGWQL